MGCVHFEDREQGLPAMTSMTAWWQASVWTLGTRIPEYNYQVPSYSVHASDLYGSDKLSLLRNP